MRIYIYYLVSFAMFSFYAVQVCPIIDDLPLSQWLLTTFTALSLMFFLRGLIIKKRVSQISLDKQPGRLFRLDTVLFFGTGCAISLFNALVHEFPSQEELASSTAKVVFGTLVLGFFIGAESALSRRLDNMKKVKASGQNIIQSPGQATSMTGNFILFSIASLAIFGLIVIFVFVRDLDWLMSGKIAKDSRTLFLITGEISFIASVIAAFVVNLIFSYSRVLRFMFGNQNSALQAVTSGDLEQQVIVGSTDEFGVMANYTNTMITTLKNKTEELQQTQDATITALAALAETRDTDTGRHILRTQRYVKVLAQQLYDQGMFKDELNLEMIDLLYKSAPLHDIGKVGVPDAVLRKPGKLDEKEWQIMRSHPILGYESLHQAEKSLGSNSFLNIAGQIALTHHEKWNGKGYPNGLAKNDIPLAGRLMALADVYDALISQRVYKPGLSHQEACQIIKEGRAIHFDPRLVDAFESVAGEFQKIKNAFQEGEDIDGGDLSFRK